jgi:hypothetical protein
MCTKESLCIKSKKDLKFEIEIIKLMQKIIIKKKQKKSFDR